MLRKHCENDLIVSNGKRLVRESPPVRLAAYPELLICSEKWPTLRRFLHRILTRVRPTHQALPCNDMVGSASLLRIPLGES